MSTLAIIGLSIIGLIATLLFVAWRFLISEEKSMEGY